MIASGGLVPHPPLLVPEVGKDDLISVASTVAAMRELADNLARENPDLVIMSSPHHPAARSGNIAVVTAEQLFGDFSRFGAPQVKVSCKGAPEFGTRLLDSIKGHSLRESSYSELDWGFTVFLVYAKEAGLKSAVLPLAVAWGSLKECYKLGVGIADLAKSYGETLRIAYVASGDLSHCTRQQPIREYDPYGAVFDESIADAVKTRNPSLLLEHKETDLIRAKQCGACSFAVALGFYEGEESNWRLLSYEDPFGVGYLVAHFEVKHNGN